MNQNVKSIKKLKNRFNNLPLKTKGAIIIIIASVFPFIILISLFAHRLFSMTITSTLSLEQEATAAIAPEITYITDSIHSTEKSLENYDYYKSMFNVPIVTSPAEMASTISAEAFHEAANQIYKKSDYVSAIRIYVDLPSDDLFFSAPASKDLFLPLSKIKGTYWYGIFQGSKIYELYCPEFYLGKIEASSCGNCSYVVPRNIYYNGENISCYIAIYYNSNAFEEILSQAITEKNSVAYLINNRDSIIASSNDYLSGLYYISYNKISQQLLSSNNFIKNTILGETVYLSFNRINGPSWYLATVTPEFPLMLKSSALFGIFILSVIVSILFSIFCALKIFSSVTSRINTLKDAMSSVRLDVSSELPEPTIHDEVGSLISSYNYMIQKQNLLMDNQQKTAEDLRLAEFKALQAQINPHFLYNTMDMINWMAQNGDNDEICEAVSRLSRFYKLTLSHKGNFFTIEEELEHVSIYMELQNMRYENAFEFIVDIPDELLAYKIPKLTLQPLVENAILHGILETNEKQGTIVITGWIEDNDIVLLLSDDGAGMSEDILNNLLLPNQTNTDNKKGTHIAVYNIHQRLQILYGSGYGLTINSSLGDGTEVKISLSTSNCN